MDLKVLKQQAEKYARKSRTARKSHIKAAWRQLYEGVVADIASIERANKACIGLAETSAENVRIENELSELGHPSRRPANR